MRSEHAVTFVDDQEMPDGHDWLMIESGEAVICAVRRSNVCPRVLEEAWAAYRRLARENAKPLAWHPPMDWGMYATID